MMPDLPTLFAQCAPDVGISTMHAIVRTESTGKPWVIGDNTATLRVQPTTKAEAVATATALIARGHNLDLGLAQINSRNLAWLGLTVAQVFDPCTNITAAATILKQQYRRAALQFGPGQQALLAAISAYNTGSLRQGFRNGYVHKVLTQAGAPVPQGVARSNHSRNMLARITTSEVKARQAPLEAQTFIQETVALNDADPS